MVSYSNYKRHLKNAHPSINHEEYANDDLDQPASKLSEQDAEPSELIIEEKDDYLECHVCGDHILKEFLDRHLKMNHPEENNQPTDLSVTSTPPAAASTAKSEVKLRDCPVCEVKMRVEGIVKHCKLKHKMSFKWCRPCEKYVGKKLYKSHIQSAEHKSNVNEGEKHSSHEEEEDEDDLVENNSEITVIENDVKPVEHSNSSAATPSSQKVWFLSDKKNSMETFLLVCSNNDEK